MVTESHGWVQAIAVIGVALFITAGALSKSELIGRLSFPATHNDIAYLLDGIRRLVYMDVNGFWAEFNHLRLEPLHAPVAAYQAALAFYLFGFHDWAPYLTNIVFLFILLFACTRLLRGCPDLVVIACLLAVAGVPLAFSTITEFAPEGWDSRNLSQAFANRTGVSTLKATEQQLREFLAWLQTGGAQ